MLSSSSDPSHRLPAQSHAFLEWHAHHMSSIPLASCSMPNVFWHSAQMLTTLCPDSGSECTPEHGVLCKAKHGAVHCWCAAGAEKAERRYFCVVQFQVCTVSLGIGSHILQRGEVHVAHVILSMDCFFRRFELRISWALLQIR